MRSRRHRLGWQCACVVAAGLSLAPVPSAFGQTETITGVLTHVWADPRDGSKAELQVFVSDGRSAVRIESPAGRGIDPAILTRLRGRAVTVSGTRSTAWYSGLAQERIEMESIRLADQAAAPPRSNLISEHAALTGHLPFVTILCRFADIPTVPREPAHYQSVVSGPGYPSLDDFWTEVSYGSITLAGSQVAGWFAMPHPRSHYVSSTAPEHFVDLLGLMDDCLSAAEPSVHFPDFAGVNIVLNGHSHFAQGGEWVLTRDGITRTWLVTILPVWASEDRGVWAHEMGHAFGFGHSGGPPHVDYANQWDLMGGPSSVGPNTISPFLDLNGWIAPSRIATVYPGSSQTVTLDRLTSPASPSTHLMVKVPRPGNGAGLLTVEVRRQFGYDAPLPGNAVLIHDATYWNRPHILGPVAWNDHAGAMWNAGETFVDPSSGIRISVLAETPTTATVLILNPRRDEWLTFGTLAGLAGSTGASDGTGAAARFNGPSGQVVGHDGNVYVADLFNQTIRQVTPAGDVVRFAGQSNFCGYRDGPRATSELCSPRGIARDTSGTLYIAESGRVRRITTDGMVSTVATLPFMAMGIAVDGAGTLYVTGGDATVRTVSQTGIVSTLAGSPGQYGAVDGVGAAARFIGPRGIAVGTDGVVYVADYYTIRRITPAGVVTTLAGTAYYCGPNDGRGAEATFCEAVGMALHSDGSLYVTDASSHNLRRVTPDGVVTTVAGRWLVAGTEDGPSPWARFNRPEGIALGPGGLVYVSDTGSQTIRRAGMDRPRLRTATPALRFGATRGPGGQLLLVTSAQRAEVHSEPSPVAWSVTADAAWILLSGGSGTGSGAFGVSIDTALIPPGQTDLAATLTVSAPAAGLATTMMVWLTIAPNATPTTPPIGVIDTPLHGTTGVTGAIPVTGWALDDVEVTRIRIFRDPVSPEPPEAHVLVGDAVFVYGARPDVAAAFVLTPMNARAGWGYMLLTNMLPHQGNGVFTLHAYAEDAEGHLVLLGSRSFTGDNLGATRPFGAIDTPEQGGAAAGSAYLNFGWALTPQQCVVPFDGSSIIVVVDGQVVGNPGPLEERADIRSLFPGYQNTNAAVGAFVLDTTGYSNGVHTIAWGVTDSCNRTDGIGSRYFTIDNGDAASTAATRPGILDAQVSHAVRSGMGASAHDPAVRVFVRRGFDDTAPFAEAPLRDGARVVTAREIERVVVRLGEPSDGRGWRYVGHLLVGGEPGPLPIGSTLDSTGGLFYWQPGPGFIGAYDLMFVRTAANGASEQIPVRIVLTPRFPGPSNVHAVIDVPVAGDVNQPFLLAGWALDGRADSGTGVDTVHVWAYPVGPYGHGAPVFLGAAHYGGVRPDVGAHFGDRFSGSAYGLVVDGLQAGTYDLAVFPRSTASGDFAPATIVRVTVR